MRAPLISLLIAAAGLAAAGCASGPPPEDTPSTLADRTCPGAATDPLHLTSNKPAAAERGDPEIDSILMQHGDARLVWVNRRMYQSLHALDAELRREQRIAACERPRTLEAQAGGGAGRSQDGGANDEASSGAATRGGGAAAANGGVTAGIAAVATGGGAAVASGGATGGGAAGSSAVVAIGGATGAGAATANVGATGGGAVVASGGAAGGSATTGGTPADVAKMATADVMSTGAVPTANTNAKGAPVNAMSGATSRSTLIKKSSLSSSGAGGNGATMPKIVAGSDNDIVARRLRKAAEQETNPTLRKKLWQEYADYRQGIAAK